MSTCFVEQSCIVVYSLGVVFFYVSIAVFRWYEFARPMSSHPRGGLQASVVFFRRVFVVSCFLFTYTPFSFSACFRGSLLSRGVPNPPTMSPFLPTRSYPCGWQTRGTFLSVGCSFLWDFSFLCFGVLFHGDRRVATPVCG